MITKFEELSPDSILEILNLRKSEIEKVILQKKKSLLKAPSGFLRVSKSNNTYQYYLAEKRSQKKGKYISKKSVKSLKLYAQKDYNIKVLKVLEKQKKAFENLIYVLQTTSIQGIYQKLVPGRKIFVEPVVLPDNQYVQKWKSIIYTPKPFLPNTPEFYTNEGLRVRSKSEILIAQTLTDLGIPFRYEYPLKLNEITVYPDFYCLNVRTRKEFIWEHFGMMDNSEYATLVIKKYKLYQNSGYISGDNLIFTMETNEVHLNPNEIIEIIEKYLQ